MKRILYVVAMLLATGCDPDGPTIYRQDCPGYSDPFLAEWFPYEKGRSYYFAGSDGSRVTLTIDSTFRTPPFTIDEKLDGNDEGCYAEGMIYTRKKYDTTQPEQAYFYIRHELSGVPGKNVVFLTFNKFSIVPVTTNSEISGLNWTDTSTHILSNAGTATINGKVFNNVTTISVTDPGRAAYTGIDRLYIAKGIGVAGYRTYPAGVEYARE